MREVNWNLFYKRLEFVYDNYYMKGIPNPSYKSGDRFPEELGRTLIGSWISFNQKQILQLSSAGNKQAKAVSKNTLRNVKAVYYRNNLFFARLKYVHENYSLKNKPNPAYNSQDRFPKELGGALIGIWLIDNKWKIESLSSSDNDQVENKTSESGGLNNDEYIAGLIDYVLNSKMISITERFSDGTLMNDFLNDNKKWIYLNRENDSMLNLLVILIEQIEPLYFEDMERKREERQKSYSL